MTLREILSTVFLFLLYLALQIVLVRNVVLFDYAFCFIYIACILLLPNETSFTWLLFIAFLIGIIVDTFYNTLGMHAAATVLMAYCRPLIVRAQIDVPGVETRIEFGLRQLGAGTFFWYVFVLALIHHTALFFIEASSLTLLIPTLIRIAASTLFTTVSIVLIQFLREINMVETLIIPQTTDRRAVYDSLIPQIAALIEGEPDLVANLANITAALKEAFCFFWIGFYLKKENQLVLGPFQGPIACTRIAFDKGVCGAAYTRRETILVPDVELFPGHIACSSASRSEIVVPVFDPDGNVTMVLDIDSDKLNDFSEIDAEGLEQITQLIRP